MDDCVDKPFREDRFQGWLRTKFASRAVREGRRTLKAEWVRFCVQLGVVASLFLIGIGCAMLGYYLVAELFILLELVMFACCLVRFSANLCEHAKQAHIRVNDALDYNRAIEAGNRTFDDFLLSTDDREAAHTLAKGLEAIRQSDDAQFNDAVRGKGGLIPE